MTPTDLATLRARYQLTGTDKPLWQEVCADVAALVAEVARLRPKAKEARWGDPAPHGTRRTLRCAGRLVGAYRYDSYRDAYHVERGTTHTEAATEREAIDQIEAYAVKRKYTIEVRS